jgi:hypothetical protein
VYQSLDSYFAEYANGGDEEFINNQGATGYVRDVQGQG